MSRKSDKFLDAKTLSPLSRLGIVIPSNAELQVCKAYIERFNSPVEESDSNKVLKLLYEQRAAFPDTYIISSFNSLKLNICLILSDAVFC